MNTEILMIALGLLWPITTGSIAWIFGRQIQKLDKICESVQKNSQAIAVMQALRVECQKRVNNHGERLGVLEGGKRGN